MYQPVIKKTDKQWNIFTNITEVKCYHKIVFQTACHPIAYFQRQKLKNKLNDINSLEGKQNVYTM